MFSGGRETAYAMETSQQWKHQNNVWDLLKVKNNESRNVEQRVTEST